MQKRIASRTPTFAATIGGKQTSFRENHSPHQVDLELRAPKRECKETKPPKEYWLMNASKFAALSPSLPSRRAMCQCWPNVKKNKIIIKGWVGGKKFRDDTHRGAQSRGVRSRENKNNELVHRKKKRINKRRQEKSELHTWQWSNTREQKIPRRNAQRCAKSRCDESLPQTLALSSSLNNCTSHVGCFEIF